MVDGSEIRLVVSTRLDRRFDGRVRRHVILFTVSVWLGGSLATQGLGCHRDETPWPALGNTGSESTETLVLPSSGDQWVTQRFGRSDCNGLFTCVRADFGVWEREIDRRLGARSGGALHHIFVVGGTELVLDFQFPVFDGSWPIGHEWKWIHSLAETIFANFSTIDCIILLEDGHPTIGDAGHLYLGRPFERTGHLPGGN